MDEDRAAAARAPVRRVPPAFRWAEVVRVQDLTPRLRRLTLGGPALAGLPAGLPAASIRVLLPRSGSDELPRWEGNEFRWPDGSRPAIRTLTPRRVDTGSPEDAEVDVDVVLHGTGALSSWASAVSPGAPAAVSGTGRGYEVDPSAPWFLVAGDETALAAIAVLLEALPASATVQVVVEVADPSARLELPSHPGADVAWAVLPAGARPGAALFEAVQRADVPQEGRVWIAGEAAGVQRIRKHLFDERGLPRSRAVIRGYWKVGRAASDDGG